jgi:tubulin polyglutamylase TTLL4
MSIDYDQIFVKIKDLIIKSILSVEPIIANNMQRSSKNRHLCFELYGFDVILDSELKPWLLEVNVLPSLSSSSALDKRIKTSLLSDVF